MDSVKTLAETVRTVVSSYATRGYNAAGERSRLYFVENLEEQVFAVLAPYDPALKRPDLVLMARISASQIIIETDKTSVSLKDELRQAGIPDEQIVLAWRDK
ncbi:MAG TPA: element excision factor XisI family protein [Aggregatilineales bacterium]|nr:element excision factor XisI family protein [Aggregatilineales bacterium]